MTGSGPHCTSSPPARRTSTTASSPASCSTARRWWCRSPTWRAPTCWMLGANPLVSHGSVLTAPRIKEAARHRRARRPRGRRRPAPHRDRGAFEWLRIAPTATRGCCCRCCTCCSRRASRTSAAVARQADGVRLAAQRWPCRSRPRPPSRAPASPPDTVRELARDLAATPRAALYGRTGTCLGRTARSSRPARRGQPRRRQPRPPGRRGVRHARPARRALGEQGLGALSRSAYTPPRSRVGGFPDGARLRAGGADGEGDHDAGRRPDHARCSSPPATRCCRCRTATSWRRRSPQLDLLVSLDLYVNETKRARRLRAAGDDDVRARRHPAAVPDASSDAVPPGDRGGRAAGRRGARGVGDDRRADARAWRVAPVLDRAAARAPGAGAVRPPARAAAAARLVVRLARGRRPVRPAPRRPDASSGWPSEHPHGMVLAPHLRDRRAARGRRYRGRRVAAATTPRSPARSRRWRAARATPTASRCG